MQLPTYCEFRTADVEAAKAFYAEVFGVEFTDYGPDYAGANDERFEIGIARGEAGQPPLPGFKTDDIDAARAAVSAAGGEILGETYEFPGGRRFHFRGPDGAELLCYQYDE